MFSAPEPERAIGARPLGCRGVGTGTAPTRPCAVEFRGFLQPKGRAPMPPGTRLLNTYWGIGRIVARPSANLARFGSAGLYYQMRKSAQAAKILGTPPERGHSCPQQLPNTQQDRNVREVYFRSKLLRTRMSALRFGSGSAGLRIPRGGTPYHATVSEAFPGDF